MLKFIGLLCVLGATISAIAQPNPDTLWTRRLGGANSDYCNGMDLLFDGGTILAGQTRSFGAGNWDFYLARYSDSGTNLWSRTYGGTRQDIAYGIEQTVDGGIIIAGYSETRNVNGDGWLVKTNSSGDTTWTRYYGGSAGFERYYRVRELSDGYICVGSYNVGGSQLLLARYNLSGDTLWTKRIGGSGSEVGYDILPQSDGGFIATGYTSSIGTGGAGFYLVRTNANGDSLWSRVYGGSSDDVASSLQIAGDGGYFIAGRSHSFGQSTGDFYLVRTNSSGDTLWTKTFGYSSAHLTGIELSADDGCYVTGHGADGGSQDLCLFRVSASGTTLWTQSYGGTGQELSGSLEKTAAGEFYLGGYSNSFSASHDVYLIKTGAEGAISLLAPNGGENYTLLVPFTVSWYSASPAANVSLEINRDYPAGLWETLVSSTADDGSEIIAVPGSPSNNCRMRVTQLPSGNSDVSDNDFSLSVSLGEIALIDLPDEATLLYSWDADSLECGTIRALTVHVKNFGTQPCLVWPPEPFATPEFNIVTSCTDSAVVNPGTYQSCFITVRYDPVSDGQHFDTLRIRTNAINAVNDYFRVPVQGFRYSFPNEPDSLLALAYADSVRLTWSPVTRSTNECALNPPVTDYVLYTALRRELPFVVLDTVSTTTYLATAPLDTSRVYRVTAIDPTP